MRQETDGREETSEKKKERGGDLSDFSRGKGLILENSGMLVWDGGTSPFSMEAQSPLWECFHGPVPCIQRQAKGDFPSGLYKCI